MASKYGELLERSVRSQEQMNNSQEKLNMIVENQTEVTKTLANKMEDVDNSLSQLNDSVHANLDLVKNHFIAMSARQEKYIKYLVILVIIIVGGTTALSKAGIIGIQ